MSRFCVSSHPITGRSWRSGHPFKPRTGRVRRVVMILLLLTFGLIIFGYNYVTDANRVKEMAEGYLTQLIGGRVTVHSATLSIFEGLRLEGVSVYVDEGHSTDSLLFTAQSFIVKYDPAKIIKGQLEAGEILAQKPHVHLTENVETHEWNFYRLGKKRQPSVQPTGQPGPMPILPEVLLRNARVEISELREGRLQVIGYQNMDGHLSPSIEPGSFNFEVQTRGAQGVGPWATGTSALANGRVDLQLHDFDFSRDLRSMLPENVREFSERHEMSGRIPLLSVHYQPGAAPTAKPAFLIEMKLDNVNFSAQQEDYLTPDDVARRTLLQKGLGAMRPFYRMGGYPNSPADGLIALTETAPIELHQGSGTFIFSDAGVDLKDVTGKVEGNAFFINGHMVGYRPDAPFTVRIRSVEHDTLRIPETPRYFNSLPPLVRDIYSIIHPDGICTMDMTLERPTPGSRLFIGGHVDVVDGKFACIFFPYTLREAGGRVTFGYDQKAKADFVQITGVHGRGMPDGPNRDSYIEVNGEVGPLGPEWPDPQIVIHVKAKNVYSEPALLHALPPEVRAPLKIFDADNTGNFPKFHGDFYTTVLHKAGWAWRWSFDTDLLLDDAAGKLVGFPYPVEHMAAEVHVRDGYVDVVNAHMKRGDASLRVDGRVSWGPMTPPDAPHEEPKIVTDLRVAVRNLPIDKDLLAALPPDDALWVKRVGLEGKADVDGRVFQGLPDPNRPDKPIDPDAVNFDLAVGFHDGTLWPADGTFSLSDLSSKVHLTRDSIEMKGIHARRGKSDLTGDGALAWGDGPVQLAMRIKAKDLPMDSPLYSLLPKSGRESWDKIQPQGTLDAAMSWRGSFGEGSEADAKKSAAGESDAPATKPAPATVPSSHLPAIFSSVKPGFYATLQPRDMTCTLKPLPYRLDGVKGTITIAPDKIMIADTSAHHGDATLSVSGSGSMGDESVWDLKLAGKNVAVDDELRRALPEALLSMLDSVKFHGSIDLDLPKFVYRDRTPPGEVGAAAAVPAGHARPAAAAPAKPPPVDVDMSGTVSLSRCGMEAGAPMDGMFGQLKMSAAVRDGKLSAMQGDLALPKAIIAGREMGDLSMQIVKPADRQELYLRNIHGTLAGGQVAGEIALTYPDEGASRYLLSLVVRNADVQTLVHEADKEIKGELTASLNLEGTWDNSAPRRGRGDVIVTGKELYHLPLVLGLFQVTNLSLPIATPFKTGTARYSVEGPRINFERVELKSDTMMMLGTGHLDFKSKRVEMTFTTDNPSGLKVPFLDDLIKNARGELLKITIKGSIQEPKVSANPFGTVTTTVDEVFRNDAKERGK